MKTCNVYNKHLTLDKRIEIEKGIDMTSTEFKKLNDIVSREIKQGHSFSMIIRNHKNEFSVGKRTLYNYVENGYLDIINLDLPRKVRYAKRKRKQTATSKDTKIRINRTYADFKDFVKHYNDNNFNIDIVEIEQKDIILKNKLFNYKKKDS